MNRNLILVLCLLVSGAGALGQEIARFELSLPGTSAGMDLPLSTDLDKITSTPDNLLSLYEITGGKRILIPFQVKQEDSHRRLYWIIRPDNGKAQRKDRSYELVRSTAPGGPTPQVPSGGPTSRILAVRSDSAVTIQNGSRHLLRYNFRTVYPPPGIDTNYKRSGFIHPLWTPHGQELTRIQPPDHYHHYGIWNPWTHVLFENDTVDFWNLKDKKGTVRFTAFASVTSGPVYAGFVALHDHVVFKKDGTEKIALHERQEWRIYRSDTAAGYYIADMESELRCATESPVLLLAYRYGGLGWRTTQLWDKDNSEVLTSEGNDRKTADGSKARWCIVQGALNDDYGGAVMLSYPGNYNYPEPLRIWPENSNNRGDMFANFDPTKDKDWLLEPGKTYTLKYRLVVFNGKFGKDRAETAWIYFAQPPEPKIILAH